MPHEMITVDTPDGHAQAYLSVPDDASVPLPGVLFIMDAIGIREQIEKMADRIAAWGYVVLAPNVFYRSGTVEDLAPPADLLDPDTRAAVMGEAMPRVRGLVPELAIPDLSAYVDALLARPEVAAGDIGVTGYCMGGRLALLAAATRPDVVGAVGIFHAGGLVTDDSASPHLRVGDIRGDLLAIHADKDRSMQPDAIAAFETALTTAGVVHWTSVYPGAAHGYTMADTSSYHHEAALHHYAELQKVFDRSLS